MNIYKASERSQDNDEDECQQTVCNFFGCKKTDKANPHNGTEVEPETEPRQQHVMTERKAWQLSR